MFLVLLKYNELQKFHQTIGAFFNNDRASDILIKFFKHYPNKPEKFQEKNFDAKVFFQKLKTELNGYSFVFVDNSDQLIDQDYLTVIKLSEDFPREIFLNIFNVGKVSALTEKVNDDFSKIYNALQDLMKNKMIDADALTNDEKATHQHSITDQQGIGKAVYARVNNWLSNCMSCFFYSPVSNGYALVSTEEQEPAISARRNIVSINGKISQ